MRKLLLGITTLSLTACVSYDLKYNPPSQATPTASTKKIDKSFESVWQALVEGLSKQNFSIDSVNKDSGLIVVSKKLDPPSAYADCGHWNGHFKNLRSDAHFDFKGADSGTYMAKTGENFTSVQRAAELNSKTNVFVKKLDKKSSSMTVSASYTLKFDMQLSTYVYPQGNVYGHETRVTEWTSQERGKLSNGFTECVSNLGLENAILQMAE